jgi:MoaA/NifB/PqqE/SkfB family radical SAM enzyme
MINMHLDKSCNLKCPTCRTEITVIRGKDRTRAELVRDRLLESGTLQNAESMILCGYGEVFASPIYLGFLRGIDPASYPNLKIKLLTNGLLLTERMWRSIASAHSLISEISISVDAATAETYKINRGGNFDRLLENMDIVARLRSTGEISRFTLNFCVQTNNFREMSSFVELAQRLGCDRVHFQKLANADKAKMHDFSERAVHLPEHPGHMEFLALLIDPIFRQRIVDLYSLSGLVKTPMQEEPEPSVVGRDKARFARSWRAWLRGLAAPFRRLSEVDSPAR